MTQQKIDTLSVTDPPIDGIDDSVIQASQDHIQSSPAITLTFLPGDVNASTDVITITGHGLADDTAVYLRSTDTLPAGLSAYTTYYVISATANDLQLSATVGGSAIDLTDGGIGSHYLLTGARVEQFDPWDTVLSVFNLTALVSANVDGLDASTAPGSTNPVVTYSHMLSLITGKKDFTLVGPPGSGADYEGSDETPFVNAIAYLQALSATTDGGWVVALPGKYTFNSTLTIPNGIKLEGVHPDEVTLRRTSGNATVVTLAGSSCMLSGVTLENPTATTKAVVTVTGQKCVIEAVKVQNYGYVGVQLAGFRNKIQSCRFESSSAGSCAVLLQQDMNTISRCSLKGTMPNGAVKIEGQGCGVFSSYFASTLTGYSYEVGFPYMTVPNPSVNDNRLVANHYGSNASLALSTDYGSDTVKYGNTPNTFDTNQNNFLVPLAEFTGQPSLTTTAVTLSNSFTTTSNDLTNILSDMDLVIQRGYEERNYFLTSTDPTFNPDGSPASGVFSWNGTNISYPQFYIRTVLARVGSWVVNAGTTALSAGQVMYVDIDQTLAGVDIVLAPQVSSAPLALAVPTDAYRLVLAVGLGNGAALWLQGFTLLKGLTSFDVDGSPLPMVRFLGVAEARNPTPPYSGFSGAAQSNLTDKLAAQSSHLKLLFERTNLNFEPLTPDAEFNTEPTPGAWITGTAITSGIPASPTHIAQAQTQTYGLDPNTGLYKYSLTGAGWAQVPGIPLAGPFTAMSRLATGIALLKANGQVLHYHVSAAAWTVYTPTLSGKVAALVPFAASRPSTFMTGGQADYHVQTDRHTIFTTLDGHTVRFSLDNNTLDWVPRTFTADVGDNGLLSYGLKDTGYNSLRATDTQFETLDNGVSYTSGLPNGTQGKFLPLADVYYDEFKSVDFSAPIVENFSHDKSSGAFMAVYRNAGSTKWYIVGGGPGVTYLYSVLASTASQFSDFAPQFWAVSGARQEVICVGRTLGTSAFAMLRGYYDNALKTWLWVNQTMGGANTCQGAIAVYDEYQGGFNYGDLWVIVSNPSRSNRPSMWKRDGISGVWTFKTLNDTPALAEDVLVPAAVSNSFDYARASNPLRGYGVASPVGISFLVTDAARTFRPTLFRFNRASLTYTGVRLTDAGVDVVVTNAVANSATQCYGGGYHPGAHTCTWVFKDNATTTRIFSQHEDGAATVWSASQLSATGLALPFTNRSGTQFCPNTISETYVPGPAPHYFYLLTNDGITKVILSGTNVALGFARTFAPADVNTGTETITLSNHGLVNGDRVTFTTSGGLPGGLAINTEYAVINATATTFQVATTTGALTPINLTSQGTGTHTVLVAGDDHITTTNLPCFSSNMLTPYISLLGNSRGGEPSIQIGSWVLEESMTTMGTSFGTDPNLGGGIFWSEPGTAVKNLGKNLWAGINRSGYLWIADASKSQRMTEFKPNLTTVRGDFLVPNLGTTTDFDWAYDPTGTKIAFVFADGGIGNQLGFLLYNLSTQLVETYERAGVAPLNPTGTSPCGSTPRIVLNTVASTWDITVQDDSRLGGQLAFYRRPTGSSAWTLERVGAEGGADKNLPSMIGNAGRNPSRAVIATNGDVVVATQVNTGNLLVCYRQAGTTTWATAAQLNGGGTAFPELVQSGNTYWVTGSSDGSVAKVAKSTSYTSGWAYVTIPFATAYSRVTAGRAIALNNRVVVASPLAAEGTALANQEFGVFTFTNSGSYRGHCFAAKGRTQSAFWSGEEETSYSNHSWTPDGKLVYGATRPGRTNPHYSVRVSRTGWFGLGDSALGSGRLLTIGDRSYREEYADAGQNLIAEYDYSHNFVREWSDLPVAERDYGNFLALRYPFNADGAPAPYFRNGAPTNSAVPTAGLSSDGTLQSGSLANVTAREFPIVCGKTRIQHGAGAGVLYHGGMLAIFTSALASSYFGGTVALGASNLFKLRPQDTLTIKGTWRFRSPADTSRSYTITGPISFNLSGSTLGHLVLNFPVASTLTLDGTANPLTFWTAFDHSQTSYSVVLGELRSKFFVLYPSVKQNSQSVKLTLGSLELTDLAEAIPLVQYCAPVSELCINKVISQRFQIQPLDIDSVSVKQVGVLEGFQRLDFDLVNGDRHLLIAQGLPPRSTGFYFFVDTTNGVAAGHDSMRIQHIVGRFGNLVVFNSF